MAALGLRAQKHLIKVVAYRLNQECFRIPLGHGVKPVFFQTLGWLTPVVLLGLQAWMLVVIGTLMLICSLAVI
jgi:hypothetical protein